MRARAAIAALSLIVASCGGGGSDGGFGVGAPAPTPSPTPSPAPDIGNAFTLAPQAALTAGEVNQILNQAIAEASARNLPSFIAVSDRNGNILAAYNMTGAESTANIPLPEGQTTQLDGQGQRIPVNVAAISKAQTAAYLSSNHNAFTTRTASMIVQEHFPPADTTAGLESGPLFGVQFSSLPCSDLVARYNVNGGAGSAIGPKRTPLGLSADPGGLPLYKNGQLVGGIGVIGDGRYGFDSNARDLNDEDEEYIALAGTFGFAAPEEIRASRIPVDGTLLRFADADPARLRTNPASAPARSDTVGRLVPVRGYFAETGPIEVIAGTPYGTEASGFRFAAAADGLPADAFVLSNGIGTNRFPIRAGTDAADVGTPMSAGEVRTLLTEAFTIMRRARGQIRRPVDTQAQVTISVVDSRGQILGVVRGPDAPVFGTDVSLQKARTAAFFSGRAAAAQLLSDTSPDVQSFVRAVRDFLGDQNALTGSIAFADRSGGNLSRPFFPDGQPGTPNGPLSRPIGRWSPFSTGLQSALIFRNVLQHVSFVAAGTPDVPNQCSFLADVAPGQKRLANGIQIFPGSVPIYRGGTLVGGIGISGDGIDQDDMIAFLGLHNAGVRLAGAIGNAPPAMRADQLVINGTRLRYVSCPFAPFLDTAEQNVCQGK